MEFILALYMLFIKSPIYYNPLTLHTSLVFKIASFSRFIDLEDWLQTRPKTSPEKATKSDKTKERVGKRRIRHGAENPLSVGVLSEGRNSLMLRMFSDDQDVSFDVRSPSLNGGEDKEKRSSSKNGSLVSGEMKSKILIWRLSFSGYCFGTNFDDQ